MKRWSFLFSLLFLLIRLQAQVPANPIGLNPSKLKWDQINTDKVQVIFPRGTDLQAQRVANVVHYLWDRHNESIGDNMHKVSIILHNQTNIPNGFVTVGPFRSEFYLTSPQFNHSTDWLDVLAIHEYRHVKQFGNSRKGITKLAKTALGSWAWGGLMATALPRWYFEGDAVGMETALTASGRGRMPVFDMEYRSLALGGERYGYEKAAAGSLRDFVPDWYSLGYYLTTYARREYGRDVWEGVVDDAVRYKGLFFPFSRSLKKRTGLSTRDLYRATRQEMDDMWMPKEKAVAPPEGKPVNVEAKRTVISYTNPHFLNDGSIVVEKRGYDRIPKYFRIDANGSEQALTAPGVLFAPPNSTLSVAGRYLCWSELGFGVRWIRQDYSNIVLYDWVEGSKRYLTSESRYFSPDIAPDGSAVVAVETDDQIRYHLSLLNINDGSLIRRLPNPEGYFYLFPRWSEDARHIAVVGQRNETHALLWLDAEKGTVRELTRPNAAQLTHPYVRGEFVYFSSAYTGINNIFAVKIATGEIFQLTDDPLGAFQPSVSADSKTLLFSSFSHRGYDVRSLSLEEALWRPYAYGPMEDLQFFQSLVEQEGGESIIGKIPTQPFEVRKFPKVSGLINPHSFLPYVGHPLYGLEILSDNKFSTLSASAGAYYNANDNDWTYLGRLSYAEFFPVFNLSFQGANRSSFVYQRNQPAENSIQLKNFSQEWKENKITAGVSLPLNFSKGNFIHRLNLSADYQYTQLDLRNQFIGRDTTFTAEANVINTVEPFFRPVLAGGAIYGTDLRLNWRFLQRTALQNLNPRWGAALSLWDRRTLNQDEYVGSRFLGQANLYLPGLMRNHSFYINAAYQKAGFLDNYRYSDGFFYPRGYESLQHDEVYKVGFNYSLPLLYPDLALGPAAFLKRVKANFFFDYGRLTIDPFPDMRRVQVSEGQFEDRLFLVSLEEPMKSAGVELTVDFRAFRLVEVDLGVRYSYLLDLSLAPHNRRSEFDFFLISITE
jgi:hypothetical protein